MSDETYACKDIAHKLAQIRREAPDEATTQREWRINNAKYQDHVLEGCGGTANGSAIRGYYVARQAYAMYAKERGFTLEVK